MRWLPESRVLRVLVTPVLQCTSQMFLHWCHIRHSEAVSPSLGHVQTVFSEFKACVGNVMLLKRGQQVLLCRYPAYAQMVRVPRAALWIFAVLKQWLLAERVVRKMIYKVQWPYWEMKNQWSCWLAGWQRCLNSGALLKLISYRPTFRRPLHRCLNNEFLQPATTSASLVSPRFNTFAIACNLAVFRSFGSFSEALLAFDFPSSPDFKHHPFSFCFTLGIFLGEPRKSEGDCQQFSSDWQVPLRQEEAFMVTGLHLGGMMVEPRLKIKSVASLGF